MRRKVKSIHIVALMLSRAYHVESFAKPFRNQIPSRIIATKLSPNKNTSPLFSSNDKMSSGKSEVVNEEVQRLRDRAKALRDSIPQSDRQKSQENSAGSSEPDVGNILSEDYRLYLDIGREDGTWMEPRWGASGKRIECTIDVSFLTPPSPESGIVDDLSLADFEVISNMVNDNKFGKSSTVRIVNSAPTARLRGGFDKTKCYGGGYRIDSDSSGKKYGSSTLRFYIQVEGTEGSNTYGDVTIPKGRLYFSLPCFGVGVNQLSKKEGIVTVRQIGWHTGWRREESRIVGVFRCLPMEDAKRRDKF